MAGIVEEPRCPECGAADWFVPKPSRGVLERTNLFVALVPFCALVFAHIGLVVARLELGHWPRMYFDSPLSLPATSVLHVLVQLATMLAVPAIVLNCALSLAMIVRWRWTLRGGLWAIAIATLSGGSFAMLIHDPAGALWFWD